MTPPKARCFVTALRPPARERRLREVSDEGEAKGSSDRLINQQMLPLAVVVSCRKTQLIGFSQISTPLPMHSMLEEYQHIRIESCF